MATPWAEVEASPAYQALPQPERERARSQYFVDVVAPNVPPEKISEVRAQFDASTSKAGFADTGSGAATGNPIITNKSAKSLRPSDNTLGEGARSILGASAGAGIAGAMTPEIMTVLGGAASVFPATAPLGPPLLAAGSAARGGRLALGAMGALGGAVGEAGGQFSEAAEWPQWVSEGTRLAGNMIAPGVAKLGAAAAVKFADMTFGKPGGAAAKITLDEIAKMVGARDANDLTAEQRKYFESLVTDLRGAAGKTDAPMKDVYGGLQSAANGARATSAADAAAILANAESASQRVLRDVQTGPVAKRQNALPEITAIGERAVQTAKDSRLGIGADREVSDIGQTLREPILKRHAEFLKARKDSYNATLAERDKVVSGREGAGDYISDLPEYKMLVRDLEAKLLSTPEARKEAGGVTGVSEQGVRATYQRILDALKGHKHNTITSDGQVKEEFFKPDFNALDDLRRKLGTVYTKDVAEGYDAINADTAKKMYNQIAAMQAKYAGPHQAELQSGYAAGSEGLQQFNTKTGKKFTALDRYDDSEFVTDAGKLPKQFFTSQQGVKDLIDLTGDRGTVLRHGLDFATQQLRGKESARQVDAWLTANRDWIKALPEVGEKVSAYSQALARAERIQGNTRRAHELVGTAADNLLGNAERQAAGTMRTAGREADATIAAGEKTADTLLGNKFPVERVRRLILGGKVDEWQAAAPAIQRDPKAKAAIADAVRQVMADHAPGNMKGLQDFFHRNVLPAVEQTGLITTKQADEMARQISMIERAKDMPEKAKLGYATRLIIDGTTRYLASTPGRAAAAIPQ